MNRWYHLLLITHSVSLFAAEQVPDLDNYRLDSDGSIVIATQSLPSEDWEESQREVFGDDLGDDHEVPSSQKEEELDPAKTTPVTTPVKKPVLKTHRTVPTIQSAST